MNKEEETIQGLIVRLAAHGIKFSAPYESVKLKVRWPEDIDEKAKNEFSETIKKNKEEIKRYVIVRDLPRHPIEPKDVVPVAEEIFKGQEVTVPEEKAEHQPPY